MDSGGIQQQAALAVTNAQGGSIEALQTSLRGAKPAEAARKFEALFASLLVKEMRQTLSQGFFGEGPQADVYAGWLDQFVGDAIARDGGLKLAQRLEGDLVRAQAARDAQTARASLDAAPEPTAASPAPTAQETRP